MTTNNEKESFLSKVKTKEAEFKNKELIRQKINSQFDIIDKNKKRSIKIKKYFFLAVSSVAAVVIFFTGFSNINVDINSGISEMAIILPDHSKVSLNANSTIKYNRLKWIFKKQLNLKGSASFDVVHGKQFIVYTELGNISVLGTRFSIIESTGKALEVSCFEGSVEVSTLSGEVILGPDEKILYKNGIMKKNHIYPPFIEYKNAPIDAVISKFEEIYSVKLSGKEEVNKIRFSGILITNNYQEALETINLICNTNLYKK